MVRVVAHKRRSRRGRVGDVKSYTRRGGRTYGVRLLPKAHHHREFGYGVDPSGVVAFVRWDDPETVWLLREPRAGATLEDVLSHEALHQAVARQGDVRAFTMLDSERHANRRRARPESMIGGF